MTEPNEVYNEIWLVPSTSPEGNPQLRHLPVAGEPPLATDEVAAQRIEDEIAATGVRDKEALVVMYLLRGLPIPEEAFEGTDTIVNALDPGDELMHAIFEQTKDNGDEGDLNNRFNIMSGILAGADIFEPRNLYIIGSSGLSVDGFSGKRVDTPYVATVAEMGVDEEEAALINELGLTHIGFENELITVAPDDLGTRYELKSRRTHHALGKLASDGTFVHIVTVLSAEHPAIQVSEQEPSFTDKVRDTILQSAPARFDLIVARDVVVTIYCEDHGINKDDLTMDQVLEIRSLPEWQNPFGSIQA